MPGLTLEPDQATHLTTTPFWLQEKPVKFRKIGVREDCKSDCAICLPQFIPGALYLQKEKLGEKRITNSHAQADLSVLVHDAGADLQTLKLLVKTHGDVIMTRWKKMTKAKREKAILQAQPMLYRHKWPEIRIQLGLDEGSDITAHGEHRFVAQSTMSRVTMLVPYLNLESLTKDPMRFLSLLHLRSAIDPEHWVTSDAAQFKLSWWNGHHMRYYNESCVKLNGLSYGQLVPWDRDQCHSALTYGYPLARAIIEAQGVLHRFLCELTKILTASSGGGNASLLKLATTGFRASSQLEAWSAYTNQPFSPPLRFDPRRNLEKTLAQLHNARDHLQLLQTDPAYFQLCLEHRRSELFAKITPGRKFELLANDLLITPIQDVRYLRMAVDQCDLILQLHQDLRGNKQLRRFEALPHDYECAVMHLWNICATAYNDERGHLREFVAHTAGFARNYDFFEVNGNAACRVKGVTDGDPYALRSQFTRDPLHWAVWELGLESSHINAKDHALLMSFIEDHLASADQKECARIDHTVSRYLAILSFWHEMQTSIERMRPRPREKSVVGPDNSDRLASRYFAKAPSNATLVKDVKTVGPLVQKFCALLWPKGKRDQSWLDRATTVRKNQDEVWTVIRLVMRKQLKAGGFDASDIENEIAELSADLSAVHLGEVAAERDSVIEDIALKRAEATLAQTPTAEPQTHWGASDDDPVVPLDKREKVKTRGEQTLDLPEDRQLPSVTKDASITRHITVKAESKRIFTTMLAPDHEDACKGKVTWDQVASAMTDSGFAAIMNGGSAVRFAPIEHSSLQGSIVFHKPHPETIVDAVSLRVMGKRLKKWFGFEVETFVERKKEME
ncbi:hypothetical protein Slin14017_G000850 [Septoria linicola]|nr:hypothetical protein Slin14017_G000850 [Septoria linicola]